MTLPFDQIQELEEKYKVIRERRLALEAEFSRIEKEYKRVVAEIAKLKDEALTQDIHKKIIDL